MDNKAIKIWTTVVYAKCSNCGFERKLYFTSDYSYGERVVSTKDGKLCAYANLLIEKNSAELFELSKEIFSDMNIEITETKLKRLASSIYGIMCDEIENEVIDNTPNWKCSNCHNGKMEEDKIFGEKLMEIEMPIVIHDKWNAMSQSEKKQVILEELKQQSYI
jgi:hypothetical protein